MDRISLQLLDSSHGAAVQTWQFQDQPAISIGRAPECDVRVGDQHVSRRHAELRYENGQWTLTSQGRNGVLVEGEQVEQAPMADRRVFRLGPLGPMLMLLVNRGQFDSTATLEYDTRPALLVHVDEAKKAREVAQIVEGDYFQSLRIKAATLRAQHAGVTQPKPTTSLTR